jgi:ethanolamine utilization protein EutA (predicted chaperonin)
MACELLTKGRTLDCNRIAGGVKYVYFGVYDQFVSTNGIEVSGIVQSAGEITDVNMTGGAKLYRYTMPLGSASVTETITGSTENGTIFYTPTVNIVLNKISKADQNEIKLLGMNKVVIFAELNQRVSSSSLHNVLIGLGVTNGMSLNAGSIDTGAAFGDRNGYTLTFDGLEPIPFPTLQDYTDTPFDNSGWDIPGGIDVD